MTLRTQVKAAAPDPEAEERAREEERKLLAEKFDIILNKLDAIDRLESVQERLMDRLENVDSQLDALDDKRVQMYGGEKARKPKKTIPAQTVVYDMQRGTAILQSLEEYYKKNGAPKTPQYTTVYDQKTQTAKLVFWNHYLRDFQAADLEARKPKPVPSFTMVYDKDNKAARLMLMDQYMKTHKMPKQDYAAVYDPVAKGVKLVFWKMYKEQYLPEDLAARKPKAIPHYTEDTSGKCETTIEANASKQVEVKQETQIEENTSKQVEVKQETQIEANTAKQVESKKETQVVLQAVKLQPAIKDKSIPHYTAVYNKEKQSVELMTWDKYLSTHKAPPCPSYAAVYDEKTKGIKLVFWNQYVEQYLPKDLRARKGIKEEKPPSEKKSPATKKAAKPSLPEYTCVYDPKTKSVKLELLEKYQRENPPKWKQAYAAVYDGPSQSVKLLFWKQYEESFLAKDSVAKDSAAKKPKDLAAKKSKPSPVYTTVYDPATREAKLVTWKEYLKTHKAPPVGNYTTVYDAKTQSCKLVTWRDYLEHYKSAKEVAVSKGRKIEAAKSSKIPEYTAVYDEKTKSVKLQLWDEYLMTNKPRWSQAYAAIYDPSTKSVKTVFWRQYLEDYYKKDLEARKEKKLRLPEQTLVYDPKTQTAKLQLWSEYIKENKPTWRQEYTVIYEPETKSMKLIYWKDYVELYEPYDLKARDARKKKESQKGS